MINFIGGLPRSGTTLLANILAQNAYVSPTSGLSNLIGDIQVGWKQIEAFKSEGLDNVYHRVGPMMKGTIEGYYEKEDLVFDKSRGWNKYIELLEAIYQKPVKVIFPIRNINEIIISFERKYKESILINPAGQMQTVFERAQELLAPGGVIGAHITTYRDLKNKDLLDRLMIVKYRDILNNPKKVLDKIHENLDLAPFEYNFDKVTQRTFEMDTYHGFAPGSLHSLKSDKILPYKEIDYANYLPEELVREINKNYKDINGLTNG